jgi:predicted enzyme related to lactoylglutathione lyase
MQLESAVFYSNDILKVISFYTEVLGLTIERQQERFVSFIFSNGVELGIKNKSEEREVPGHQTIFIKSENIEKDYADIKSKGAVFNKELTEQSFGKEFSILDPDGNKILFIKRQ